MLPSLNITYFIGELYQLVTGGALSPDQLQSNAIVWFQYAEWIALALSVLLLINYVWLRVQTHHVEEEIHHKRLAAELAMAGAMHDAPKNARWENVVDLANSTHESDWRRAILEADSMLAELLTARGFPGEDIGEQLRGINPEHFATIDMAWEAHRMRNRIAHDGESFVLTERDVHGTIDQFKRVFEEFDYI